MRGKQSAYVLVFWAARVWLVFMLDINTPVGDAPGIRLFELNAALAAVDLVGRADERDLMMALFDVKS